MIAADVVYEPESYEPLVEFLADAHGAARPRLAHREPTRRCEARLAMLVERGFSLATEAVWVPEDGKLERTWLHELRR